MQKILYRIDEAAETLATSRSTIYRLIERGDLEAVSLGKSRLITAESIDRFVAALRGAS